jgi:hypothetical protein
MVAQGCKDGDLMACRAVSYTAALQTYRPLLGELSSQNADVACLTSILLLVDGFAALQYRSLDVYKPPMEWLRIVQGTRAVFEASYDLVKTDSSSNFLTLTTSYSENDHCYPAEDEILNDFAPLVSSDELIEHARESSVYVTAVRRINAILYAFKLKEPPESLARRLMAFPCTVPAEFLDMVASQEPYALVVLGHFFALSASAQCFWWIGKTPWREVEAICRSLPHQYVTFMDWPRNFLRERQLSGSPL